MHRRGRTIDGLNVFLLTEVAMRKEGRRGVGVGNDY
jgi:hypothetical protein